jgi:exportin-7
VAKAYFALLEVLCHNHTGTIACQDSPTFAFILNSLDQVRVPSGSALIA